MAQLVLKIENDSYEYDDVYVNMYVCYMRCGGNMKNTRNLHSLEYGYKPMASDVKKAVRKIEESEKYTVESRELLWKNLPPWPEEEPKEKPPELKDNVIPNIKTEDASIGASYDDAPMESYVFDKEPLVPEESFSTANIVPEDECFVPSHIKVSAGSNMCDKDPLESIKTDVIVKIEPDVASNVHSKVEVSTGSNICDEEPLKSKQCDSILKIKPADASIVPLQVEVSTGSDMCDVATIQPEKCDIRHTNREELNSSLQDPTSCSDFEKLVLRAVVYTTRLNRMNIFKEPINDYTAAFVKSRIIAESKPDLSLRPNVRKEPDSDLNITHRQLLVKLNQYNNIASNTKRPVKERKRNVRNTGRVVKTTNRTKKYKIDVDVHARNLSIDDMTGQENPTLMEKIATDTVNDNNSGDKIVLNLFDNLTFDIEVSNLILLIFINLYQSCTELFTLDMINGTLIEYHNFNKITDLTKLPARLNNILLNDTFYKKYEEAHCCWQKRSQNIKIMLANHKVNNSPGLHMLWKNDPCLPSKCKCCCSSLKVNPQKLSLTAMHQYKTQAELIADLIQFSSGKPDCWIDKALVYKKRIISDNDGQKDQQNLYQLSIKTTESVVEKYTVGPNGYIDTFTLSQAPNLPRDQSLVPLKNRYVKYCCCWKNRINVIDTFQKETSSRIPGFLKSPDKYKKKCTCYSQTANFDSVKSNQLKEISLPKQLHYSINYKSKLKKTVKYDNISTNSVTKPKIYEGFDDDDIVEEVIMQDPLNIFTFEQSINTAEEPQLAPSGIAPPQTQNPAVNSMINVILKKFSHVSLSLNSTGKVVAELNNTANNLSTDDLKILASILGEVQTMVDSLKANGNTNLNPIMQSAPTETYKEAIPSGSMDTNSTTVNKSVQRNCNPIYDAYAKIMCLKNYAYKASLNSFIPSTESMTSGPSLDTSQIICDTSVPVIQNVFSLAGTSSDDILQSDTAEIEIKIPLGRKSNKNKYPPAKRARKELPEPTNDSDLPARNLLLQALSAPPTKVPPSFGSIENSVTIIIDDD